ncbi:MAG: glycogen synthase GlgA [Elusimicrobia bacterium]|nr:MAG: glycogen synthase GlgA [Elusimicrobiota bacterium]
MRVVFAASEAVPFCKTGGLADVAGSLPQALGERGVAVTLFLPYYREVRERFPDGEAVGMISVPIGKQSVSARLLRSGDTVFIDCPQYFDRVGLYGDEEGEHPDNDDRFGFFARSVLEGARVLFDSVDVFHVHDWQTGLLPLVLKTLYAEDPVIGNAAVVQTVHNLAFQGNFPKDRVSRFGLPWSVFTAEGAEFYDQLSFLKSGLVWADRINTVSPTYAREITTTNFGCGLDGVLIARKGNLSGILNGIDVDTWNPQTDEHLVRRYGRSDFVEGKAACKAALQRETGLEANASACLFASVTRVSQQKGLDLVLDALEKRVAKGDQFVLLGKGDVALLSPYRKFRDRYPDRVHLHETFDESFAHQVYAGADAFVMPSRFEPCGLGQMIAMRYGTLPIGVATGGLADTVRPHGFLAARAERRSVAGVIGAARRAFEKKSAWQARIRDAMGVDFSWKRSAKLYEALYNTAINR